MLVSLRHATLAATIVLCPGDAATAEIDPLAIAINTPVTYAEHIAPILNQHCVECHRPGMGAPFEFLDYEAVRKKAKLIAHVTDTGFMPPWKPERGHTAFLGERGLDANERALLQTWVAQGRPEGDPTLTPPLPEFPANGWRLGDPDLIVEMDEAYAVPADGADIYRNFVLPLPDLPEGTRIRAVEYQAGAPDVVHHCLIGLDELGWGRFQDKRDPGPGFEAMDQLFEDTRLAAYAVGSLPYFFPEGVSVEVKPGADLILEMHFHPTGKAEREHSRVGLYLTQEQPTRELVSLQIPPSFGLSTALDIPAGESRYQLNHRYTLSHDVELFHAFPHAHYLCTEVKAEATLPSGDVQTLISIKDWDFAWQEQYRFVPGTVLPAGTVIDMQWTFDNSAANPFNPSRPPRRVTWGQQTTDEMASLGLSVMTLRPEETDALHAAHHRYQKEQLHAMSGGYLQKVIRKEMLARFDENENGDLDLREFPKMIRWYASAARMNRGTASWDLEHIIIRRGAEPNVVDFARGEVWEAAVAGLGVAAGYAPAAAWWIRTAAGN